MAYRNNGTASGRRKLGGGSNVRRASKTTDGSD